MIKIRYLQSRLKDLFFLDLGVPFPYNKFMRKIIHIDMDAFFAAVEMRDQPHLKTIPMAVGGSQDKRGVLCTANYEARKFGVKAAMASAYALKLCPQLVIIRPRIRKYAEVSEQIFQIFSEFTDLIEPVSLDEAYLDVSSSTNYHGSGTLMAQAICQKIFKETGLTASAGIAPNKLLAKLASDVNKPNGLFTLPPHQVESFMKTLPVNRLWGVGKVMSQKLQELGIKNCEDLEKYSLSELSHRFGKFGEMLFYFCRGIDEREVETDYERKSLGTEETFAQDLSIFDEMKVNLIRMSEELIDELKNYPDKSIKNIHVKIKYSDFKQTTIERQLDLKPEHFLELFSERWAQDPRPIRLLGVGVKFEDELPKNPGQLSLLT